MPSEPLKIQGKPDLIEKILSEIGLNGPISFARFMELALYDVPHGYYMTKKVEPDDCSSDRIGWGGDYVTAPELSPILAKTLVRQILTIDEQLGRPAQFTFMEIGAGNGTFAFDFIHECRTISSDFFHRLSYQIVERSSHLQSRQAARLREVGGDWGESHLSWKSSIEEVDSDSVIGVVFSNELVDALPVHRVRMAGQCLHEICVAYKDGRFVECLDHRLSPELMEYIETHKVALSEGQTSELHLAAERWMKHVARLLQRGIVVTVDYGHTRGDYYRSDRKDGTFLCYYRHAISTDPYVRVGEQDMTAHVNFSALASVGTTNGLDFIGLTTMANWLIGLGVEDLVRDQDQESEDVKALAHLLRPHGMGTTFKVLAQRKGMKPFALQGLRYRAFFDDVVSSH
ncbi:MAG: SAM-dependent methyltransferase [Nitrospira sp.]|nr:SAM-dependent methyltransferase [Nitrospira sp.]